MSVTTSFDGIALPASSVSPEKGRYYDPSQSATNHIITPPNPNYDYVTIDGVRKSSADRLIIDQNIFYS